jgi:dihydroorotase/N-acyl-D-amino-acid deacylase
LAANITVSARWPAIGEASTRPVSARILFRICRSRRRATRRSSTTFELHRKYQGLRISQIAEQMHADAADALLEIVDKADGQARDVFFGMREEDVAFVLSRPWVTIGSDGAALTPSGILARDHPHPRSYGTFPRVLGQYVREAKLLSLPDAIHKMTALPADRLGLADRGRIAPGQRADIVVFDPAAIADRATFEVPHQLAAGVQWLLVNGVVVVSNGAHTGALPGRVLRHQSAQVNSELLRDLKLRNNSRRS